MIGQHYVLSERCEQSSMDWAKSHIDQVSCGTLFLADYYATARGSNGRVWHVYPGQLVMTFVLKPRSDAFANHGRSFNMALTLGVAKVLQRYGAMIKEPNDFFINGKKVGGILIQPVWSGKVLKGASTLKGIVVGFAINVKNTFVEDDDLYQIATSLKDQGHIVSLDALQRDLIVSLNRWYALWLEGGYDAIVTSWKGLLKEILF